MLARDDGFRKLVTIRTIVSYSEGKLAEMERPSPVVCHRVPAFPNINKVDRSWSESQTARWQRVPGHAVSLYGAYYDDRTLRPYVRILAMFNGRNFTREEPLYCQTRGFSIYQNVVEVVATKPLEIWWHEWDQNSSDVKTPLLLSCPLSTHLSYTSVVSVVTKPCEDPVTSFVIDTKKIRKLNKRNFTVCVKDMNFNSDVSRHLVEWIEINKILGADVIDVYVDNVHKDTAKVLKHYRDKGFLRLFHAPINHVTNRSLWQRRRDHVITYNDCLYRNIAESEFIIPLDIDEILLPKVESTWKELVESLVTKQGWNSTVSSAILVRNIFFYDVFQSKIVNDSIYACNDTSKHYSKRDDVRLRNSKLIAQNEIDLIDNKHKLVINEMLDRGLRNIYSNRCRCNLEEPKLVRHLIRSALVSPVGHYSKSLMVTKKVLTAFNHYPLNILGVADHGWPAPFNEVQLNHYKEQCNAAVMSEQECEQYVERACEDRSALRLRRPLQRALLDTVCACT